MVCERLICESIIKRDMYTCAKDTRHAIYIYMEKMQSNIQFLFFVFCFHKTYSVLLVRVGGLITTRKGARRVVYVPSFWFLIRLVFSFFTRNTSL